MVLIAMVTTTTIFVVAMSLGTCLRVCPQENTKCGFVSSLQQLVRVHTQRCKLRSSVPYVCVYIMLRLNYVHTCRKFSITLQCFVDVPGQCSTLSSGPTHMCMYFSVQSRLSDTLQEVVVFPLSCLLSCCSSRDPV